MTQQGTKWISFHSRFTYSSYQANIYKGKLSGPNFSTVPFGKEKEFQKHLLSLMEDKDINFAGHYTIVETSCGAMCASIYIVDRKTGQIFADLPVNNGGRWGYRYQPTSALLIANAEILNDDMTAYSEVWNLKPEIYQWDGKELKVVQ